MYTLKRDTEITAQVILDIIEYSRKINARYDKLEAYYIGQQEILNRNKVDNLSNNKVMINHARYITDINVGYLMGNPVEYQVADGYDIKPLLDVYKNQTINDLDTEIAKDMSIYGVQYEYVYANENAEPRSAELDNRNVVLVHDTTMEHNKLFGIIYRAILEKNKKEFYEVIYTDDKETRYYTLKGKNLKTEKEEPHAFGAVPIIEYRNNPEYLGDFEDAISLIDAYNLLQSDRINDKEQLVDAILWLKNMDFTNEQVQQLKEYRVLSSIPPDGDIGYLIKTLNEADTDVLRKTLENDIHKVTMTPNMSDANFIGNSSGVAIRYKLLAFEQRISNKERYFEKGLMERFELYNNFLSTLSRMSIVPVSEVDAIFKRNLPLDDYNTSQMINNLLGTVDRELLVSQLSFVKDSKETVELALAESEADMREYTTPYNDNQINDSNTGGVSPNNPEDPIVE